MNCLDWINTELDDHRRKGDKIARAKGITFKNAFDNIDGDTVIELTVPKTTLDKIRSFIRSGREEGEPVYAVVMSVASYFDLYRDMDINHDTKITEIEGVLVRVNPLIYGEGIVALTKEQWDNTQGG